MHPSGAGQRNTAAGQAFTCACSREGELVAALTFCGRWRCILTGAGGSAGGWVVGGGGGEVPKDRPTKVNGFMTHTSPDGPATLCRKAGPHPSPIRFQGHGLQNRAWPDSGLSPSPASAPFAHTQRIGILSSAFPLGNGPTGCPGFRISSGVQTDGTCPRTPRDMIKR